MESSPLLPTPPHPAPPLAPSRPFPSLSTMHAACCRPTDNDDVHLFALHQPGPHAVGETRGAQQEQRPSRTGGVALAHSRYWLLAPNLAFGTHIPVRAPHHIRCIQPQHVSYLCVCYRSVAPAPKGNPANAPSQPRVLSVYVRPYLPSYRYRTFARFTRRPWRRQR